MDTILFRTHLQNLERISRIISHHTDVDIVIREMMREVLDIFQADRAWLLYPCDPTAPTWRVPVEVTAPEYPGAFVEGAELPMDEASVEVTTSILNTKGAISIQLNDADPPPDWWIHYHIKAQLSIGLYPKVDKPWIMGLHQCSHARAWTDEEKYLFQDIAERFSDSLCVLLLLRKLEEDITERKRIEEKTQELLAQNRSLTQRLFSAQEEERQHLARELRNEFGQRLTAMQLYAQAITQMKNDRISDIHESAQIISDNASKMLNDIRVLIAKLRPSALDDLGLTEGLKDLIERWCRLNPQIMVEFFLDDDIVNLGEALNITVYRIIQEALTNIVRHAEATRVKIKVQFIEHQQGERVLELLIKDNGKGIDLPSHHKKGFGLTGIRERALAARGSFELDNHVEGGVQLFIRLPAQDAKDTASSN